jgi:cation-transporting ATPase E
VTTGLSSAEVAERTARGQANDVPRRASRSAADIVTSNLFTLFNAIIGSLCALILVFGQPQDALFGLVIVANTGIGIVQELRAKAVLEALALVGEEPVRVLRDGAPTAVQPGQLVLGDQLLLAAGDAVVVDAVLTASAGLEADESLLTGEADAVHKVAGDQLLSGSFITAGSGSAAATKVGADAYAARLTEQASRFSLATSQLRAGIDRFLRMITWLIIPVAVMLTVSQLRTVHKGFADAVSATVAGIITMIPEGLVLLTSVAFAVGVVRLGARNCLVQELPAIEVLARVDVLCLDKTGTLTEIGMDLEEVRELPGATGVRAALAALSSAQERPNATVAAIAAGLGRPGGDRWRPVAVVPFSSARKWSGAVFDGTVSDTVPGGTVSGGTVSDRAVSGGTAPDRTAPDRTLPDRTLPDRTLPDRTVPDRTVPDRTVPGDAVPGGTGPADAVGWVLGAPDVLLDPADPVRSQAERIAATGRRVLVAGQVDPAVLANPDRLAGSGLVRPAAIVVLRQRLRAQAAATIRYFTDQGVAIKVISGDNAASAGAVAAQLGIPGADHPVDARTLPGGHDHEPVGISPAQLRIPGADHPVDAWTLPGGHDHEPVGISPAQLGIPGADHPVDARTLPGGHDHEPAGISPAQLEELARALSRGTVFGRVSPQQKRVFVGALQSAGHTVAMTGDGVNDVLALKDADLGVAMGSGSGASRAVAKVVLLDNNFAALPQVVAEGRRVLANIERVASLFLTKTVYAILLAVAVAVTSLAGLAGQAGRSGLEFPFLPRHLTLISTLTIGVPAFVLALARSNERARPGFVPRVLRFAIPAGTACALATFASYLFARLGPGGNLESDRTTATIALFSEAIVVLALVARPYTWWRIALVAAMGGCFAVVLALPSARRFFLLDPANARNDLIAATIAAVCAAALITGLLAARRWRPPET